MNKFSKSDTHYNATMKCGNCSFLQIVEISLGVKVEPTIEDLKCKRCECGNVLFIVDKFR